MQRNIILIVDDEKDNREILKNIFEEQYRILEAADCESAIGLIKERNREIALCFVDLQMPDRSGCTGIFVTKRVCGQRSGDCHC